jgi:hypothetical protein
VELYAWRSQAAGVLAICRARQSASYHNTTCGAGPFDRSGTALCHRSRHPHLTQNRRNITNPSIPFTSAIHKQQPPNPSYPFSRHRKSPKAGRPLPGDRPQEASPALHSQTGNEPGTQNQNDKGATLSLGAQRARGRAVGRGPPVSGRSGHLSEGAIAPSSCEHRRARRWRGSRSVGELYLSAVRRHRGIWLFAAASCSVPTESLHSVCAHDSRWPKPLSCV